MRKLLFTIAVLAYGTVHAQFMGGFGGGMPMGGGIPQGFGGGMPMGGGMPGGFGGFGAGTTFLASQSGKHVDFESSNLPIIVITTDKKPIGNSSKSLAQMKVIDNAKGRNKITDKTLAFQGNIGIKLRGESSLMFEQKSFTIELWDEQSKSLDAPLLDMPANDDWALIAAYNDISMMRNPIAYDLWTDMGHWGPRNRMVEVVIDGEYQGVYMLVETIKGSKERLSLADIKSTHNSGRELTGGYILRIDATDSDDLTFTSRISGISKSGGMFGGMGGFGGGMPGGGNPIVWTIRTPKKDNITEEQREYIENYIHQTEAAIQGPDFADPEKGYAKYISVSSFVDYLIHTELSLNADGMKRSTYFFKTREKEDGTGGKLHAGSVWDYNLAFGNASFNNTDDITTWIHEGGQTLPTTFMFKRLMEDPVFVAKVKARYKELRKDVLSLEKIYAYIDSKASELNEAQQRQFSKYTDLLVPQGQSTVDTSTGLVKSGSNNGMGGMGGFGAFGGGFGGGMIGMFTGYRVSSYSEEIQALKSWFKSRIAFLDSQWLD